MVFLSIENTGEEQLGTDYFSTFKLMCATSFDIVVNKIKGYIFAGIDISKIRLQAT